MIELDPSHGGDRPWLEALGGDFFEAHRVHYTWEGAGLEVLVVDRTTGAERRVTIPYSLYGDLGAYRRIVRGDLK